MKRISLLSVTSWVLVASAQAAPQSLQAALEKIDPEIQADHYSVAEADLNADGKTDVLALMNGKSAYCGSGGCTLFLMQATDEGYASLGTVKVVNPPIYLRKSSSGNHRDLLVTVRGGGAVPGLAVIANDGTRYPPAPGEALGKLESTDVLLFRDPAATFEKTEQLQGITFKVSASHGKVTVTPAGLEIDNRPISVETTATVKAVEVGDINADGAPEIYIYATQPGEQQWGELIAFSSNKNKSLSAIHLPPLEKNSPGYRGRDEFAVVEGILARRFPIFPHDLGKTEPTGKIRQLQYKLTPGEAGWLLKVDQVVEF